MVRMRSPVRSRLEALVNSRPVGQGVKTPPFHGGNRGSNPLRVIYIYPHLRYYYGGLAQLGEHLPYKQRVGGSIPSSSTIFFILFIRAGVAQLVEQLTCNQ